MNDPNENLLSLAQQSHLKDRIKQMVKNVLSSMDDAGITAIAQEIIEQSGITPARMTKKELFDVIRPAFVQILLKISEIENMNSQSKLRTKLRERAFFYV